jgi:hypothetical protein
MADWLCKTGRFNKLAVAALRDGAPSKNVTAMARSSSDQARWALFILLGVGLLFLVGGGIWAWKTWAFTGRARHTKGKIERLEVRLDTSRSRSRDPDSPTYAPVFSFRDTEGRHHLVTSAVSHGKSPYEPGQEVPVLYDPDDPENARLDSFVQLWLFPLVFGFMGTIFAGIAALGWQKMVVKV